MSGIPPQKLSLLARLAKGLEKVNLIQKLPAWKWVYLMNPLLLIADVRK